MTAYINSIKGICNSEEGFPKGALGMTALAVSCHHPSVPNPVCSLQVDDLRLSRLSLHTIAVMSLLIWYRHIPLYFRPLLLSLRCRYPSHTTRHCDIPCDICEPARSLASHCPTLVGPITNRTIGPASHIECTCDLRTPPLHFPFLTGPHVVFWWYVPCFTLPIRHCDTR